MDDHAKMVFIYRQRAEELRVMIPDMKDRMYAKILEKIAADYDRLAEIQERIAELGQATKRREPDSR